MAKEKQNKEQTTEELLRNLLIVQLRLAGLTQRQIRETLGVGMNRVTQLTKHINPNKKSNNE